MLINHEDWIITSLLNLIYHIWAAKFQMTTRRAALRCWGCSVTFDSCVSRDGSKGNVSLRILVALPDPGDKK